MSNLRDWIRLGREKGASDLLLEAETPVVFRVRGELIAAGDTIPGDALVEMAREALGHDHWQAFLEQGSADLSRTLSGTRCRIHAFRTVRGVSLAIRLLSSFRNTLHDCNLHPDLRRFTEQRTGLILVTGPTGSGKSTTLAALIEEINLHQRRQILVIESPIEYFFKNRHSFIRQREVPSQSPSFEQALTDAMRENPDVMVVGEMRTPDVMRLTLNAAETGHLVIATMHSATSAEALARLCMSFSPEIQGSIRAQLADCLVGVICQRLTFHPQQQLRIPLCEILVANTNVKATIRSGQFSQISSAIQTGGEDGMYSVDRYQRWIDQKRDWVRPSQAQALDEPEPAPSAMPQATPPTPNAAKPAVSRPTTSGSAPRTLKPSSIDRVEIAPTEEDLEALAKRISDSDD
jgi:twitching motility protein PilT